jgi:hypothetical protein
VLFHDRLVAFLRGGVNPPLPNLRITGVCLGSGRYRSRFCNERDYWAAPVVAGFTTRFFGFGLATTSGAGFQKAESLAVNSFGK